MGNNGNSERLHFFWFQPLQMMTAAMKLKKQKKQKKTKNKLAPWKEGYDQSRQHFEKQRHYFSNKGPSSQSYGFFQ